jgi:hypothetical protein
VRCDPVLAWLGVVIQLLGYQPVDAPVLSTPNRCTGNQVMRNRGIRIGEYEVMGLRSCLRGFQRMGLGIRGEFQWWTFGDVEVAIGRQGSGTVDVSLRRHDLARGALADGTPAVIQTLDVDIVERCFHCDTPKITARYLQQTITVCALPVGGIVRCGQVEIDCARDGCPKSKLVHGVVHAGSERITVD